MTAAFLLGLQYCDEFVHFHLDGSPADLTVEFGDNLIEGPVTGRADGQHGLSPAFRCKRSRRRNSMICRQRQAPAHDGDRDDEDDAGRRFRNDQPAAMPRIFALPGFRRSAVSSSTFARSNSSLFAIWLAKTA